MILISDICPIHTMMNSGIDPDHSHLDILGDLWRTTLNLIYNTKACIHNDSHVINAPFEKTQNKLDRHLEFNEQAIW